jgi:hypothetical protein
MAIVAQVRNTGASGGHGMQTVDAILEAKRQECELVDAHKGHVTGCGTCGENFHLPFPDYTGEEVLALSKWLANGGCPYCGGVVSLGKKFVPSDEVLKNINNLVEHVFVVRGKSFKALRIPDGYKRPVVKKSGYADQVKAGRKANKIWVR